MRLVEARGIEVLHLDDVHPLVIAKVTGPSQIDVLRRSPFVAYVESATFDIEGILESSDCGSSGSSSSSPAPLIEEGDPIHPGDIVPYTLVRHSVLDAWEFSTGSGKAIGVVDTGTSVDQPQLGVRFASGFSSGRAKP